MDERRALGSHKVHGVARVLCYLRAVLFDSQAPHLTYARLCRVMEN